ncbi:hypothetical protein SDC9_174787 [bioreactor metagenome]|uniref:Uncharacterized protein n=1 Tax=bioreactor metagenome TaxID=1076179 RepID=A0A645GMB8_9ZZZZ
MRQMRGFFIAQKGELQYPHTRKSGRFKQFFHIFTQITQILGNQLAFSGRLFHLLDEFQPRPGFPLALSGSLGSGGDAPIRRKAPEMVKTQTVKHLRRMCDALAPPGKSVLFHAVPVVDRVFPKLPVLGEIVRRYPRDALRGAVLFQQKLFLIGPDVTAVIVDINRQVA